MALVQAKMSFYHDSVGTRAKDEMFDVQNEQLISELEQAGYIQRAEGEALQAFEAAKSLEQQVGQRNALTNEAVSLAGHEHNQQAAQHQQQFGQMRQAEKAAQENAALSQTQATNTKHAEAEQAAANTATSAQAQQGRAKKADR